MSDLYDPRHPAKVRMPFGFVMFGRRKQSTTAVFHGGTIKVTFVEGMIVKAVRLDSNDRRKVVQKWEAKNG